MLNLFLVVSNGFILPTIYKLSKEYKKYYIELFTFISIFIISSLYHACSLYYCTYDFYKLLWKWDQIFALQGITTTMMHLIHRRKKSLWIAIFFVNIIFIQYTYTLLIITVFFNLFVIIYQNNIKNIRNVYLFFASLNINQLLITLILVVISLTFFMIANMEEYLVYHTLWHFFIFSSVYTSFYIKQTKELVHNISLDNFANYPKSP
jgi:hypothetical protein